VCDDLGLNTGLFLEITGMLLERTARSRWTGECRSLAPTRGLTPRHVRGFPGRSFLCRHGACERASRGPVFQKTSTFPRYIAPKFLQYLSGNEIREGQNSETLIERNLTMKTYIVYDLDSKMPVAVGDQVSAEAARYCASAATGIFPANLLAEEIDLENTITR